MLVIWVHRKVWQISIIVRVHFCFKSTQNIACQVEMQPEPSCGCRAHVRCQVDLWELNLQTVSLNRERTQAADFPPRHSLHRSPLCTQSTPLVNLSYSHAFPQTLLLASLWCMSRNGFRFATITFKTLLPFCLFMSALSFFFGSD